uniref:Uncharacterized protein n=1 Tax=Klebsiella pneumoniae TaxID=573 RepID=A0A6G9HWJ0_KLEPN|nr:hypothetical protein [Klebsiella pneumoniae]QIQ15421.1 hypothetical protein [Klebsiella pneumoniae]
MLKKTVITSAVVSALLLSSSGIAAAVAGDKSGAQTPAASRLVMSSDSYGEIIGQFNSPDGAVVGATLPGKSVSFSIPVKKHHGQYLHFAFMHAASASEGWFFAPASEQGINLTGLMTEDVYSYIAQRRRLRNIFLSRRRRRKKNNHHKTSHTQ